MRTKSSAEKNTHLEQLSLMQPNDSLVMRKKSQPRKTHTLTSFCIVPLPPLPSGGALAGLHGEGGEEGVGGELGDDEDGGDGAPEEDGEQRREDHRVPGGGHGGGGRYGGEEECPVRKTWECVAYFSRL